MALTYLIYFTLSLSMLATLLLILARIGKGLAACPVNGQMLRAVTVSVCTGFATIALGCLTLLAVVLSMNPGDELRGLLVALGIGFVGLGIGFGQALATIRGAIPGQRPDPAPMPDPDLTDPDDALYA